MAENYDRKPYPLGSFVWGTNQGGTDKFGTVPTVFGPLSKNAINIVKNDYPSFNFDY